MKPRILFIFGTRPEAVKLCPLVLHLRAHAPEFNVRVAVTAQHRQMLDQVLAAFGVTPDHDLNCMAPGQSLFQSTARILAALEPVLKAERPALTIVQGDTTTTLCGALAGFYARVPVAHVEAGLRTYDLAEPFPEEANRLLTGRVTTLHFAATPWARENLLREGTPDECIVVTGNTGIDAVLYVRDALAAGRLKPQPRVEVTPGRRLVLVTAHRRESFGAGFEEICAALAELAARPDVELIYPVHLNPNVREVVHRRLGGRERVRLIEPLDYVPFIDLLCRAEIVLTDSGGIQEEAPSLGKPVLVMRDKTERPEAVEAGTALLVGPHRERIVSAVTRLLDDPGAYAAMARAHNPYGDGQASDRILAAIRKFLG
jgi:UDP-N-acetylglucosamine 2-epimerase (non-hydrolysing)